MTPYPKTPTPLPRGRHTPPPQATLDAEMPTRLDSAKLNMSMTLEARHFGACFGFSEMKEAQ